jgi:hypothetical protein
MSCLVNTFVANDKDCRLVHETMFDPGPHHDTSVRSRIVYVKLTRLPLP